MGFYAFSFTLFLCWSVWPVQEAGAQSLEKDSLVLQTAYSNAVKVYHQYVAPETGLYRGSQYVDYAYMMKEGHPFFGDGHPHKGSVMYDGVLYENLNLLYDLVRQQIVLNDPFNIYKIFLIGEEVDSFAIDGHRFVHLRDSLNPSSPGAGFYELLYAGGVKLYRRDRKNVQEDPSSGELLRFVQESIAYYLKIGDAYYPVNTKSSLSHALGGKGSEARKFIRKNKLDFKEDKEKTLISVISWYDQTFMQRVNP